MIVFVALGCGGTSSSSNLLNQSPALRYLGRDFRNIAGADIRDTWKETSPIKSHFGLEPGGTPIGGLLDHADLPQFKSGGASAWTILGSKNGITYGQQMSGPTDTIDIDFTGYFAELPDYVQGALERAGKSWSYRLKDKLGPYLSTDEVVTRLERTEDEDGILRPTPWLVDGILIDIDSDYEKDFFLSSSSATFRTTQTVGGDFTVRTGWVDLKATTIEEGGGWLAHIASHEIGHAIGHDASHIYSPLPETIARYVDFDRGVWTGPALTAAHGGREVEFQLYADGEVNFGHLGACAMIMSYCGNDIEIPHDLDFAFMKDIGYTVEDSYPTVPEQYSYGAWAEHSSWGVLAATSLTFAFYTQTDHITVQADAFGESPNTDFASTHIGTLTWNGSLLATDLEKFAPVFGDTRIVLSGDTLDGSVSFTNLRTVKDAEGEVALMAWRRASLGYGVKVEGNSFRDVGTKVSGDFYGPQHEEVAGVLNDGPEKILGAFGGTR